MKKGLFSALTLALLYGCASQPIETESKPVEPRAQLSDVRPHRPWA